MRTLTRLERRILAVLEEAGEDYLVTLINTVATPRGLAGELEAMGRALLTLVQAGYVEMARPGQDVFRCRRIPVSSDDACALSRDLKPFMAWSCDGQRWMWRDGLPHAELLLTDAGAAMSEQILTEDGWPVHPLKSYE